MTYCSECEEWVEIDEGRCIQCDTVLRGKKKLINEDSDETDIFAEEVDAISETEGEPSLGMEEIPLSKSRKGRKRT